MDVNWNGVYGFWLVAEHGSFAAAARTLPRGSVQALHKRVRKLESEENLNLKLFRSRGVKGVELTEAGRRLHQLLTPVFQPFDLFVAELQGEDSGPLTVVLPAGYGTSTYVPVLLQRLHRAFPKVTVSVLVRSTPEVRALVESGRADFGLGPLEYSSSRLVAAVKIPMRITILAPKGHPYTRHSISWKDVWAEPVILAERGTRSREIIDEFLARKKPACNVQVAAEVGTVDLAMEAVRAGFGLALIPSDPRFPNCPRDLTLIDPPPGLPDQEATMLYRPDRYMPKYMRAFLDIAVEVLGK